MHFPDEAWLDFARRLLPPEDRGRMQAHLDSGCEKCAELHRLWTAVGDAGSREADYAPDEWAVSAAKSAYAGRWWRAMPPSKNRSVMLVFDSFFTAGAPAGVRSALTTARHLLYQSGTLAIDVRFDPESENAFVIAGQILKTTAGPDAGRQWDVTLLQNDAPVARTIANDFGEFHFECGNGSNLRIRIETEGQQPVTLTLPD